MPWNMETVQKVEDEMKLLRIKHLEEQAMNALQIATSSNSKVVFPNALIAGDAVITHLLSRLNLLKEVPVLFVNTLHLFDETLDFIEDIENHYEFKGHTTMAQGIGDRDASKAMYDEVYGADL